jgi:DNA modification methylase
MRTMPDCSVDAVVTDPPYGLSFMGKAWDYDVPGVDVWREVLRVLKPGGHLLAFAGTRTQHRMAVAIEDAGFEIRDMIAWCYGNGFPKSLDVSKAIDKAAGAEREVVGQQTRKNDRDANSLQMGRVSDVFDITVPATPEAQQWAGWGTALKPALEPITVARKPFKGTVAANVLEHGTGALNVDGCRVHGPDALAGRKRHGGGIAENHSSYVLPDSKHESPAGRWPANLIHDGSEEICEPLGDAIRLFYTIKSTKAERQGVTHPTVKPLDLMAYLCRLVTPPGGTVLDPFMGSGTTIKAALSEGFNATGIERDPAYFAMAEHRMNGTQLGLGLNL